MTYFSEHKHFFRAENEISLPNISVIVANWDWQGPLDIVFTPVRDHIVAMSLDRGPQAEEANYRLGREIGEYGKVGNLTFAPAGSQMNYSSRGTPRRMVQCVMKRDFQPAHDLVGENLDRRALKACLDLRLARAKQGMLRLAEEVSNPGFGTDLLVEALALAVLVDVSRRLISTPARSGRASAALAPWQVRRIEEMLHDFSDGAPTIADLARECKMSRWRLSRGFRTTTGCSVHEYVAGVRVARAKALLADRRLSLKQIAFQLGFSTQSSFSFAFSSMTGICPREFRRQLDPRTIAGREVSVEDSIPSLLAAPGRTASMVTHRS